MPTDQEDQSRSPWYVRWRLFIVGVGAIAAALLAVLSLWDRVFPPDTEDAASITSAEVTQQMSLGRFAETASGTEARLGAASASVRLSLISSVLSDATTAPPDSSDPPDTSELTSEPTTEPTTEPTPTETTTPTDTTTPSDTTTPTATTEPTGSGMSWPPSQEELGAVASQPVLNEYEKPIKLVPLLFPTVIDPQELGGGGVELDSAEIAVRLADALRDVEWQGEPDQKDPRGWVVAVNLDVSGLKDVPLLLTWSLDGLDVPVNWAATNVAYRLTPTTDHDAGSVEVWVPNLARPGEYNVNLELARESDGTVLTRSPPVKVVDP